jgi:hypothetical protein
MGSVKWKLSTGTCTSVHVGNCRQLAVVFHGTGVSLTVVQKPGTIHVYGTVNHQIFTCPKFLDYGGEIG